MRIFSILFILVFSFFIFYGCSTSEEPEKQELTKEQADELFAAYGDLLIALGGDIASQSTNAANFNLSNISSDFGGLPYYKPDAAKAMDKAADGSFNYDGNGCWTLRDTVDFYYSYFRVYAQVCYDDVDVDGIPTPATDGVTIAVDYFITFSEPEASASITMSEIKTLNLSGVAGFRNETGNLTINGTDDVGVSFIEGTTSAEIDFELTLTDVVLSPQGEYPLSGTLSFEMTVDAEEGGQSQEFTVSGKITFNGTNMVPATFAGYNYTVDLDAGI
jgi:hypothetical protein